MCSHNRAIHNNRAIPSKIIRNRGMGNSRVILTRDMTNKVTLILTRDMTNKVTLSRDMVNSKDILSRGMSNNKIIPSRDTLNKAILNKDMRNNKTISNRVMDNHLPGKTCRPGNCP